MAEVLVRLGIAKAGLGLAWAEVAARDVFADRDRPDGTTVVIPTRDTDDISDGSGATSELAEGYRRWLSFASDEVPGPEMVARVLAAAEVRDLTLEPPDLDEIIRRIHRGEIELR